MHSVLQVPLDYSLHAYLEVMFLEPKMKIYVQGSVVSVMHAVKDDSSFNHLAQQE